MSYPRSSAFIGGSIAFTCLALILSNNSAVAAEPDYQWNLPKGFPKPSVPPDNPMSAARVELGRYLFYDTRMSVNGKQSCASCHKQEIAFTDGRAVGLGATGESHTRGAMSLVNVAWSAALTWNNPDMKSLEKQALVPMYGEHPVELGLREGDRFLPSLRADAKYQALFEQAFPNDADRFTVENVTKALASFERSIVSARSPYDRYHYYREDDAVSDAAKRGEIQFFDQRLSCFRCHGGPTFSDSREFHDTGVTANAGKFKAPTLRNISLTAPYMHDGSIPTLEGVIDHYAAGGKNGHDNPDKDPLIAGFTISPRDRADLVEFLKSLTDNDLIHDPRFANPWH
jgi:cytochrome c peroxidase